MTLIPYGYKMNNGQIIVHSEHAEVIRTIFSLRLDKVSSNAIANYLNEHELWKRSGLRWYHRDISKILNDGRYCGQLDYPRIISEKIYDEIRKIKINQKPRRWINEFVKVVDGYSGREMQLYDGTWKIPAFQHYEYFDKCAVISDEILVSTLKLLVRRIKHNPNELILKCHEIVPNTKVKTLDKILGEVRGKIEDQYVIRETLNKVQSIYDLVNATERVDVNSMILRTINSNSELISILRKIISKVIVWDEFIEVLLISNQVIKMPYIEERKEYYGK